MVILLAFLLVSCEYLICCPCEYYVCILFVLGTYSDDIFWVFISVLVRYYVSIAWVLCGNCVCAL